MEIEVKIIDTYKSQTFKGKTISEFLIYLKVDNTPIEAYTVIGDGELSKKITDLKKIHNLK